MVRRLARVMAILPTCLALVPQPEIGATAGDPVIAAAGDIACSSSTPTPSTCRHRHTAAILRRNDFDAVLTLGDNQYESGTLTEFRRNYHPTWGRFKSITHPSPGNHEYATPNAAGYFAYFGSAAGDPDKGYYSFDLGSWHIVALNSNCESIGGCHPGSPQELWLRSDLAAHGNECTLAYWHHPSGMGALWQTLYEFRVDIILNGHDHNYQRFAPQTPSREPDPSNGIRQFVVGTGGRSQYAFTHPPAPNTVVRNADTFGVLELVLRPTSYEWRFIPEEGKNFTDSGRATCVGGTVLLEVRPRRVAAGGSVELTATVLPCQGNEGDLVRFQRRRDRAWRTVATVVSDQACSAGIERRVNRTTRFRAVSPADEDSGTGTSRSVKVSVRNEREPTPLQWSRPRT